MSDNDIYLVKLPNQLPMPSTYKNAKKTFLETNDNLVDFVKNTSFSGGHGYTLNNIIHLLEKKADDDNDKKSKQKKFFIETKNRLTGKLKRFNLQQSMNSNLNDQIYYLVAWIKGLVRRRHTYDSSSKDWSLLPFYDQQKHSWALLDWGDKQRPVIYSTAGPGGEQQIQYICAIDNNVIISQDFYRNYNPIVKYYPTRKKLLKIMQLAYNLHVNRKQISESNVEYLYTLIAFEEPYFGKYEFEPPNIETRITLELFENLITIFTKGSKTDISINRNRDDE